MFSRSKALIAFVNMKRLKSLKMLMHEMNYYLIIWNYRNFWYSGYMLIMYLGVQKALNF